MEELEFSSTSEHYRIFGDLVLENPEKHLRVEQMQYLLALQPFICDLERRSLKSSFDYLSEFSQFKHRECALWDPPRSIEELVPPSGDINAPIANRLHNPSFTTLNLRGGETADGTNPCIQLLLESGFTKNNSLIYDHLSRREVLDGISKYPKAILDCHEGFLKMLRSEMTAKVEVVWGRYVRLRALETLKLERLQLWGDYKDITIYLEWDSEETSHTQHVKRKISRFIVFVMHPQVFLYGWGRKHAMLQDRYLSVAAKLASTTINECFFQELPRFSKSSFAKLSYMADITAQKNANEGNHLGTNGTSNVPTNSEESTIATVLRDANFDPSGPKEECSSPTSIEERAVVNEPRLRIMLEQELARNRLLQEYDLFDVKDFEELPAPLKEWLWDHTTTLFSGTKISSTDDLIAAYHKLCTDAKTNDIYNIGIFGIVSKLMQLHADRLQQLGQKQFEDLIYYGTGPHKIMKVKCKKCGQNQPDDTRARWSRLRPHYYVIRETRTCPSSACFGKKQYLLPQDSNVRWVFADRRLLTVCPKRQSNWRRLMRDKDECVGLPMQIESWCWKCHEATELSPRLGKGNKLLDKNPRWTIGDPPKYITRAPQCYNCHTENTRFIPIDDRIQSIRVQQLGRFEKEFSFIDDNSYLAKMLGARPGATRAYHPERNPNRRAKQESIESSQASE
ncbi:hypothetical protein L228DRAFT_266020 [Xylona heveae TC161]|uniref:Uncharacterized protein n=1 Tax=Xylona heveae (strain CBS 132557 / TC161) TaxID=1328760 RepID=A0A165IYJ7_XYLHT|nr:hypothetical protein L228DRAFT_266020 [Xylona heveae TC161]KZF25554.1 hypothetical protein L228DRAFT_266020 [Xylona heveae TC161]